MPHNWTLEVYYWDFWLHQMHSEELSEVLLQQQWEYSYL